MPDGARWPFWLALTASVMLHLAALVAPGWGLPPPAVDDERTMLKAQLVVPAQVKPAPPPQPPPKKPRPRAQPAPAVPIAAPEAIAPPAPPAPEPVAAAPAPLPERAPSPEPLPPVPHAGHFIPPAPTFDYASSWPQRGRIVFQVTRGEGGLIVGQSEHRWTHDDRQYELRTVTETVGLAALFRPVQITQVSQGLFVATGLQPQEFRTERDGKLKDNARIEPAPSGALPVQDMLSLFYQLGALPLDVTQFSVAVHTGRKLTSYTVTVGDTLVLDTALGERRVQHFKIAGDAREDSTEIWLDTASHLPLKIRHRDRKGEIFDQVATTVELEGTP